MLIIDRWSYWHVVLLLLLQFQVVAATNISTLEGLSSLVLVFICSCVFLRRVRALKSIALQWKPFGPLSIFHKASVIGQRLSSFVATLCVILAIYVLVR